MLKSHMVNIKNLVIAILISYSALAAGEFTYTNTDNLVGMATYTDGSDVVLEIKMNNGTCTGWVYRAPGNDMAKITELKSIQAQIMYAKVNGFSSIKYYYSTWPFLIGVEVMF